MRLPRPATLLLTVLLPAALLLAACGKDGAAPAKGGSGASGDGGELPVPEGTRGSVTGMPDQPGPGPVGAQGVAVPPPAEVALDADGNPLPPDATAVDAVALDGVPGEGATDPAGTAEPSANDAVSVLRDYFAAINSGNFARAYALWADGGRASGQSPQGFADGFADTTGISVELLPSGRVDAAAGSRYVEVPVTLRASLRDGGERHLTGAFTLRRAVVDGASAEQRTWRISAADLRDVAP